MLRLGDYTKTEDNKEIENTIKIEDNKNLEDIPL